MRNGQKISVDDMDINHLRNALKMVIRNQAKIIETQSLSKKFTLNGDIAQEMYDRCIESEYYDEHEF